MLKKINLFTQHWDSQSHVPYLTGNNSLQTFVSYDNKQSVAEKARYIVKNNLRGAIIWEITGDYLEISPGSGVIAGTPLADTLNYVFCHYTPINKIEDKVYFNFYPNPTKGKIIIYAESLYEEITITIINILGNIISSQVFNNSQKMELEIPGLQGIYIVQGKTKSGKSFTFKVIKNDIELMPKAYL